MINKDVKAIIIKRLESDLRCVKVDISNCEESIEENQKKLEGSRDDVKYLENAIVIIQNLEAEE